MTELLVRDGKLSFVASDVKRKCVYVPPASSHAMRWRVLSLAHTAAMAESAGSAASGPGSEFETTEDGLLMPPVHAVPALLPNARKQAAAERNDERKTKKAKTRHN